MIKMKRLLITMISTLLAAMWLSACSPPPAPAVEEDAPEADAAEEMEGESASEAEEEAEPEAAMDEVVELEFWSTHSINPFNSAAQTLIDEFEANNPNINIEHRPVENEQFFTALRTAFTSNEEPDIFTHEANNNLFQFVETGQIAHITEWYEANGDRFSPGTEGAVSIDGRFYGVPTSIHTGSHIYYNAALLEENGIDPESLETWDDYLAAFETLEAAGITPIALGNKFGWPGSQWFYALVARTAGAEKTMQLVAGNCGYSWTDPDVLAAAELYTDLADSGYFSSGAASDDYPQAKALFYSGQAGFFHTGSWFISEARSEMPPDFQLGANEFPVIADLSEFADDTFAGVLGGVSITEKAVEDGELDAALVFLDYWTSVETQQCWVEMTGEISTIEGALTEDNGDPLTLAVVVSQELEGNTGTIPFLEHVVSPVVGEEAIWMGSVGVLTGQLTAEEWMQNVQDAADAEGPTLQLEPSCEG